MKSIKIPVIVMVVAITLFACKKKAHQASPEREPTITIHSPGSGSQYRQGDTVYIHAALEADRQLHGYQLFLIKENADTVFYHSEHTHHSNLEIQEKWIVPFTAAAKMKLVISTSFNHDGGSFSTDQQFQIN